MDEVNIHIDELVVGPDADLLGQIRMAAGDRLGSRTSQQVAEQISAAFEAGVAADLARTAASSASPTQPCGYGTDAATAQLARAFQGSPYAS